MMNKSIDHDDETNLICISSESESENDPPDPVIVDLTLTGEPPNTRSNKLIDLINCSNLSRKSKLSLSSKRKRRNQDDSAETLKTTNSNSKRSRPRSRSRRSIFYDEVSVSISN